MRHIIDFNPLRDSKSPLPERTPEEEAALKRMHQRVINSWKYLEDPRIQETVENSKDYAMRAVDVCRIWNNEIPLEFTATTQETYEDFGDFLEYFQSYINTVDSIWLTSKDKIFVEKYSLFSIWIQKNEPRIIQDQYLWEILMLFEKNTFPLILHKLANKLWIIEDIIPGSDMKDRVFYELEIQLKKAA